MVEAGRTQGMPEGRDAGQAGSRRPLRFFPPPLVGPRRVSALGDLAAALPDIGEGVRLDVLPFPGQLQLSGDGGNADFLAAVDSVLECTPPRQPWTVAAGEACEVLWTAPDEWLILLSAGQEEVVSRTLQAALQRMAPEVFTTLVDLSDARVVFHLYGPNALAVLHKGCAVDLHPRSFSPGCCTRTLLAGVSVLLQSLDGQPGGLEAVYRLFVPASLSRFMVGWLRQQCQEF